MVRLLHLADLHLGWEPPFEDVSKELRRLRDLRIEKAVTFALEQRVDVVVIAGDLFESHRPSRALADRVQAQLSRLVQAGIEVVTVPGNHDELSYHDSVYRERGSTWPGLLVTNPHFGHVASLSLRAGTLHLYSMAYVGGVTRAETPLADFPKKSEDGFHVAVLHGSVDFHGGDRSLPIDKAALADAGYDYAALGHIHGHQRMGGPSHPLVYAGLIDGKGFDDPGGSGYVVVTMSDGASQIDVVDADPVVMHSIDVDAGAFGTFDALLDHIDHRLEPGGYCRLRLQGAPGFSLDGDRLRDALAPRVAYLCVDDATRGMSDVALRQIASERTVRGAFVSRMLERISQADPNEERLLRRALVHGLEALEKGVAS